MVILSIRNHQDSQRLKEEQASRLFYDKGDNNGDNKGLKPLANNKQQTKNNKEQKYERSIN
jgi:hypothetical protein